MQKTTRISPRTIESILKDKRNNTVYTVVAFRHLTYGRNACLWFDDSTAHGIREGERGLKNHRITICTDIGR